MGSLGGLIGTAGGQSGTGINAPSTSAGIVAPTNADQIQKSYDQNLGAISAQGNLMNALAAQNGIGNQSQVYNQLQGVINGTGPNPAAAQLAQATGANTANQAALMAGQRGAGSNVGLIARQAAQQGAANQQNAAGQAATLQAQQSLNALNNAGNIANTQTANQLAATTQNTQARQSEQQNLLNAIGGYNATQAGLQSGVNAANASLANTSLGNQQKFLSGSLNNGVAGVASMLADGGTVSAPQSSFGKFLNGWQNNAVNSGQTYQDQAPMQFSSDNSMEQNGAGVSHGLGQLLSKLTSAAPVEGGGASAMTPVAAVAQGGAIQDHRAGGPVKATNKSEKATVKGNSYSNDKIPAVLSEGEFVIDRESMNDKSPLGEATRKLVEALKAKKHHMAQGGEVQHFAENGEVEQPDPEPAANPQAPSPAPVESPEETYNKQFDLQVPENIEQQIATPNPMQVIEQRKQEAAQAGKQDYLDEAAKWDNDLYNGHIQPKTYKDLFNDKSTLGKIGTLFGMFVSGGGSAVAGQPNALLQMMDKQIANDLQGQIHSKENAKNFWNLSQQDLTNKVGAINNLQAGQTAKLANARGKMEQTTLHSLYTLGQKLPPAEQAKWNSALQALSPQIMQNAANYADRFGAAMAAQGINPYSGSNQAPKGNAPVSGKKVHKGEDQEQPSSDHLLKEGSERSLKNLQYDPTAKVNYDAIREQHANAALADKAIDTINQIYPQMQHESEQPQGYVRRQAHNLAGVPVVGPFVEGVARLATDNPHNREYESDYSQMAGAVRGALRGQVSEDLLDQTIRSNAPEEGDSPTIAKKKIAALKDFIKSHTKTDLLESAHLVRKSK